MKLGLKIALRFLTSNKGQTILIILGIAIGVSVQIFIGSLIQGLQKGLVDKTIGNSSQITINSNLEDRYITDYNQLIDKISLSDDNITKISPVLDNQAFLSYEDNSQSLLVRGFDMEKADGIYDISNRIVEGKLPAAENEILLGINLKDEYGISIGDEISILTVDRKSIKSTVVGFFDLKVSTLNSNWGITTLKNAQAMFENEEKISSIEMQVNEDSIFITDEIALNVLNTIGSDKYKAV
ncbi:MAG: ABC transporter permease, partial [Clostridia bacterium]|nr:ABC transporter permease [Clostridia bacterium]